MSPLRQPLTGFLNLAPTTSGGYPQQQPSAASTTTSTPATATTTDAPAKTTRRSSSVSTVNSTTGQRFLKLGPVHFGEHLDPDNKEDWSAVTEE